MLPEKAIKIPVIFFEETCRPKIIMPATSAKIGVSAFNVPASALSIFVSAMQNKKDGKRLPNIPDRKIIPSLSSGMLRIWRTVSGSKTIPAEATLKEATW